MLGKHLLKGWSTTQSVIALSSGEAEYYGMVRGGTMGLGLLAIMKDMGITKKLEINTDASAAHGIAQRTGLGKVRHLETCQLWLQQKVGNNEIGINKVNGKENLADALTKHVSNEELDYHIIGTSGRMEEGRHELAPKLDQ